MYNYLPAICGNYKDFTTDKDQGHLCEYEGGACDTAPTTYVIVG